MSDWTESLRGMVFPVHCDHMNHANNRWYAHFFDDAMLAFWSKSGLTETALGQQYGASPVQIKTVLEFHHELRGGDQFVVLSAFTRIGRKSITCRGRLYNAVTGRHCASYLGVSVFLDGQSGKSTTIPQGVRAIIEPLLSCEEEDPS